MSELTIPERVAAGAAWLDANKPGWMDRIFLDSLDLSSCTLCVLGQVFGDFCEAPEVLDAGGAGACQRGFDAYALVDEDEEFAELTAEWRRLIESRRSGAVTE